tara:strand:- start:3114 stop:3461 length:348 start_codon:yes stop_codon:yes gene_type:complete
MAQGILLRLEKSDFWVGGVYLTPVVPTYDKEGDLAWFGSPSTNWSHGGPIIEREEISVAKVGRSLDDAMAPHPDCWCSHIDGVYARYGPTPLIAAMRCFVASKLGEEVEIPEELS